MIFTEGSSLYLPVHGWADNPIPYKSGKANFAMGKVNTTKENFFIKIYVFTTNAKGKQALQLKVDLESSRPSHRTC